METEIFSWFSCFCLRPHSNASDDGAWIPKAPVVVTQHLSSPAERLVRKSNAIHKTQHKPENKFVSVSCPAYYEVF